MPTFSIIVPAYNVQDYIEEALTSIAGQSFVDFEAIIVDDGSTDATGAIAMFVGAATRPGDCELQITALQGDQSATEKIAYLGSAK